MTTLQIVQYYANLLILQYKGKPRANATVQAQVTPVIMDQLPAQVQSAFSLDFSTGVQLDVIGKYAGISRNAYDFTGPVVLNDDEYRLLIKIAIVQNNSGSSLATIQNLLQTYFQGTLQVFDYADMTLDYFFESTIGSNTLAEVFVKSGLLPRPMGVRLRAFIYAPTINNFFGMRRYEYAATTVSPLNTYSNYNLNFPWLSYNNALIE